MAGNMHACGACKAACVAEDIWCSSGHACCPMDTTEVMGPACSRGSSSPEAWTAASAAESGRQQACASWVMAVCAGMCRVRRAGTERALPAAGSCRPGKYVHACC